MIDGTATVDAAVERNEARARLRKMALERTGTSAMTQTRKIPFLSWFKKLSNRDAMSSTFCIYPFKSLQISTGGAATPCCVFEGYLHKHGEPMSVYEHSIDDIWNSENMRDIRRAMIAGQTLSGCEYCYRHEREGVQSHRIKLNGSWQPEIADADTDLAGDALFEENVKRLCNAVQANDYKVMGRPEWLELDVGNLCNLKCRMCHGSSSSTIAADPVHSRWAYLGLIAARWQGAGLVVAPARVLGVASEGIASPVVENGAKVGWTDGNASLRFSVADVDLAGLEIQLSENKPAGHPLKVSVNNQVIFYGALPPGPWRGTFDLGNFAEAQELEIQIVSPVFQRPELGRSVGVGIEEVKLLRKSGGKSEVNTSRFSGGRLWFQETEFLLNELLAQPEKMTRLRLIGGEPLLIKEVVSMMRHLVETGAASNIMFVTITNGTVMNEEFLELAQYFKYCGLVLSLDGFNSINDYIRFPSHWNVIDENIERFKQMKNTYISVNMTVQAYNVLSIVDLIKYCIEKDIVFQPHLMQHPPYLSIAVLPPSIREIAAERLLSFLKEQNACANGTFMRSELPKSIAELAAAIRTPPAPSDGRLVRDFMVFTNDMDASRGQSFAKTLPELHELLTAAGTVWVGQKRYAG